MSNRPTPETDYEEQIDNGDTVPLFEFCRKMERERDEARELAQELRDAITPFVGLNPSSPRVKVKWPDFVERAKPALTKAKEVLP
jgi:hypothetical protein